MAGRSPERASRIAAAAALGLLSSLTAGVGCSQDYTSPAVYNLDRPSDLTFACYGDLRITEGEPATNDMDVLVTAQPLQSCQARLTGEAPEGQEQIPDDDDPDTLRGPVDPSFYAFALQPAKGTVAVVNISILGGIFDSAAVGDSDPLTPGKNAVPIGTLPVGLVTGYEGCHVISANAGSCDLSILDLNSALDQDQAAIIERVPIVSQSGETILAKPSTIVAEPPSADIGYYCPDRPGGLVYVTFPECNLIGVIETSTGEVVAGVRFAADGSAELTDGNVTCPVQCGDGSIAEARSLRRGLDDGPGRPVALTLNNDGSRLFAGAENKNRVYVIDLDGEGLPASVRTVDVEGDVGLTALSVSGVVNMGGSTGKLGDGSAGAFQFVYAVASDRTVRVVEVRDEMTECDTQVDSRYLHDVRDVGYLSCMPAGDPTTPPRRPGSQSPGIVFPRDSLPLDVAITTAQVVNDDSSDRPEVSPYNMVGWFAFVTMSDGYIYVVNIDDDNYPDFEDSEDPAAVYMPLAVAHQIRDFVSDRDAVDGVGDIDSAKCETPDDSPLAKGPRLGESVSQVVSSDYTSTAKVHLLPYLHTYQCIDDSGIDVPVTELDFGAPVDTRELTFPDITTLRDEEWRLTWEGQISLDSSSVAIDGPPVRRGYIERGADLILHDDGAPFCRTGVEPYDIVVLRGCDPSNGDAECGVGETCYVHPDTPTSVGRGLCLPRDKVDQLSGVCRDVLVSRRRYTVLRTEADQLTLGYRRRVLRTTPVDGCESAAQCEEFAELDRELAVDQHPIGLELDPPDTDYSWGCAPDPTHRPGPDKCQMTCEEDVDCEDGWSCAGGYCVEGVLPTEECMPVLQRYQVRVGEAFAVIGQSSGFLHHRIRDADTGECIDDPDGNPLLIGRLPLEAPPCEGDGLTDITPNPCSTTVEQFEEYNGYDPGEQTCTATGTAYRTREAPAIRFRNPGMTFHLVDPYTHGDAVCNDDRAGDWPAFSTVYGGYQLRMTLTGGRYPMFVSNLIVAFPARIKPGPIGGLWILDEGDVASSLTTTATQGRIVRIDPDQAANAFNSKIMR